MVILLRLVRWLLGIFLLFMALGSSIGMSVWVGLVNLLGALIQIPPTGAWIGRYVKPLQSHGRAIGAGAAMFLTAVIASLFVAPSTKKTDAPSAQTAPRPTRSEAQKQSRTTSQVAPAPLAPARAPVLLPAKPVDVGAKVNPDGAFLIEGEGWDKTRRQWGASGVERINRSMPLALRKAAESQECDYAELAGLSDRSVPRDKIVFYVDCRNGKRFFISEADIRSSATVVSKNAQTAAISDHAAIEGCERSVKGMLHFPLTFDRHILDTSVHRAEGGNTAVEFVFDAKNVFGATR